MMIRRIIIQLCMTAVFILLSTAMICGALPEQPVNAFSVSYEQDGKNIIVNFDYGDNTEKRLFGDMDGDDTITAADARIVLRASLKFIVLSEEDMVTADVNYNGKVTSADARIVLLVSSRLQNFVMPIFQEKLLMDYWAVLEEKTPGLFIPEEVRIDTHFGTFSGCEVVCMAPSIGYTDAQFATFTSRTVDVAGYEFYLHSMLPLLIYKDAVFAEIDEAYEMGWITKEDVYAIWQVYQENPIRATGDVSYYASHGSYPKDSLVKTVSIHSVNELNEYCRSNGDHASYPFVYMVDTLNRSVSDNVFLNTSKYNEDFFEDNFLLFIHIIAGGGGPTLLNLQSISCEDDLVTVTIKVLAPSFKNAVITNLLVVLAVDKDFAGKDIAVKTRGYHLDDIREGDYTIRVEYVHFPVK